MSDESTNGRLDPPRRFGQNRLCSVDPHGFERLFWDPGEDEPLPFAFAVEPLSEERMSRYHWLRSLCPIAPPNSLAPHLSATPYGQGGSRTPESGNGRSPACRAVHTDSRFCSRLSGRVARRSVRLQIDHAVLLITASMSSRSWLAWGMVALDGARARRLGE